MSFVRSAGVAMLVTLDRLRRKARRFVSDSRAMAAVEFAFMAPVIIAMILATLQAGVIFVAKAYLETGAEQAARLVLTNEAVTTSGGVTSPMTQAQFQAAVCGQLPALFTCSNLMVQLVGLQLPTNTDASASSIPSLLPQFNSNGTLQNPTSYSTPSSGETMLLSVMYQWPVYGGILGLNWGNMGNGTLLMTSTQIFKVEV